MSRGTEKLMLVIGLWMLINVLGASEARVNKDSKEQDIYQTITNAAKNYIKNPQQLQSDFSDLLGTVAQNVFPSGSQPPSGATKEKASKCQPKKVTKNAADLYNVIDDYFQDMSSLPYTRFEEQTCDARQPTPAKEVPPDNVFGLLGEMRQFYEDLQMGKPFNYTNLSLLVFRFLDYLADNPGMDRLLLTMMGSFINELQLSKQSIESSFSMILDAYRQLRKMGDLKQMVLKVQEYLTMMNAQKHLTTEQKLESLKDTISQWLGSKNLKFKALAFSAVDFVMAVVAQISPQEWMGLNPADFQELMNKFMLLPLNELGMEFNRLLPSLSALSKQLPALIESSSGKDTERLERKIPNFIKSFETVGRQLKLIKSPTETKLASNLKELQKEISHIIKILNDVNYVGEFKGELQNLYDKIQIELKRWQVVKRINSSVKSISSGSIAEISWVNLVMDLLEVVSGIPRFQEITNKAKLLFTEMAKLNFLTFPNSKY